MKKEMVITTRKILLIIYVIVNFYVGFNLLHTSEIISNSYILYLLPVGLMYFTVIIGILISAFCFYLKHMCNKVKIAEKIASIGWRILLTLILIFLHGGIYVFFIGVCVKDYINGTSDILNADINSNMLGDIVGTAYVLYIIYIVSMILENESVLEVYRHTIRIYKRNKNMFSENTRKVAGIIFMPLVLFLIGGSPFFSYNVFAKGDKYSFLYYPVLLMGVLAISDRFIKLCVWNYDWEKKYAMELKTNEIAPNIHTIPFPESRKGVDK